MADNLSKAQRSAAMARVRSKDTSLELDIRRVLRRLGAVGYRLHRKELPGNPDIVWVRKKRAIFVHGCFWHGHTCKRGCRAPKTNREYWQAKIQRNRERDRRNREKLLNKGWNVLVVWECEANDPETLEETIATFLS